MLLGVSLLVWLGVFFLLACLVCLASAITIAMSWGMEDAEASALVFIHMFLVISFGILAYRCFGVY